MTWYWQRTGDGSVEVWDHTSLAGDAPTLTVSNPSAPTIRKDSRGVPVEPDVRGAVFDELLVRGVADLYAIRAIAEVLTGTDLKEGSPP